MTFDRPIVQSPLLGRRGRFANWLVQYQWSLRYSNHCRATLQTHPWIGETLFEINHERIVDELPVTPAVRLPYCLTGMVAIPMFYDIPNHYAADIATRETMARLRWRPEYDPSHVPVKKCVAHLRGGDFIGSVRWPQVSTDDLLDAVVETGVDRSDCFIVSDDIPSENNVYPSGFDFLYDFQLLMRAETVFVYPSSTFSIVAALFNHGTVFQPVDFTRGKTKCRFVKE